MDLQQRFDLYKQERSNQFRQTAEGIRHELARSSWSGRIAMAAAGVTLGAEYALNGVILVAAGTFALTQSHYNIAATAIATGGVSTIEQAAFCASAVYMVSKTQGLLAVLRSHLFRPSQASEEEERPTQGPANYIRPTVRNAGKGSLRVLDAFGWGASVLTIARNAREQLDLPANIREGVRDVVTIGLGNAALAAAVATSLVLGSETPAKPVADLAITLLTNPLTYAAILGARAAVGEVRMFLSIEAPSMPDSEALLMSDDQA